MSVGHGKNCESSQGIGARNPEVWRSIPRGHSGLFLYPTLVTRQKNNFLYFFTELKLAISLILFRNMTLSTLLIPVVCRTSLTLESLWLSGRASKVRFLTRTHNFYFCPTLVTRRKTSFSNYNSRCINQPIMLISVWMTGIEFLIIALVDEKLRTITKMSSYL